jgi:cytoskeletal protein CcmA (bactofilin family)
VIKGLPMFKRRKPDEPEPAMEPTPTLQDKAGIPAVPVIDTGVGVPPRPMPFPSPAIKDPTMGRPPFSPLPAAQPAPPALPPAGALGNPPMPPSAPPRPAGPPARPASGRDTVTAPERRTLVVGRGISVQGTVQDAERLVVEGMVEASMIHAAELSVSLGGVFKGEIQVEDAEVAGTIDGTVTARGSLVVRASGVVLGTARCRRLQVEDGGQITGRIEMLSEGGKTASPVPVEPPRSVETAVEA